GSNYARGVRPSALISCQDTQPVGGIFELGVCRLKSTGWTSEVEQLKPWRKQEADVHGRIIGNFVRSNGCGLSLSTRRTGDDPANHRSSARVQWGDPTRLYWSAPVSLAGTRPACPGGLAGWSAGHGRSPHLLESGGPERHQVVRRASGPWRRRVP